MRQGPVELEAFDIGVEGLARNPGRFSLRPEALEPFAEALFHRLFVDRYVIFRWRSEGSGR